MSAFKLPSFESLPLRTDGPPLNAWGLFGDDDELGRLNLITPDVIKAARNEIEHGLVINLNLPQNVPNPSIHPDREPVNHIINHRTYCNDDIVVLNTQTSTQWDGFKHYPYKHWPEKGQFVYYNGQSNEDARDVKVKRNGVQNFCTKPITSRGVLLDVARYIQKHDLSPLSHFDTSTPIPVDLLGRVAQEQDVSIQQGDILLVRTGWTEALYSLSNEEIIAMSQIPGRPQNGVAQGIDTLRWHWERGIAAVVSDVPGYEAMPEKTNPSCHEVFLAGWGMPIGEMFDLRELAKQCDKLNKWTFLFTSMALYLEGGVATPPNAQAIL